MRGAVEVRVERGNFQDLALKTSVSVSGASFKSQSYRDDHQNHKNQLPQGPEPEPKGPEASAPPGLSILPGPHRGSSGEFILSVRVFDAEVLSIYISKSLNQLNQQKKKRFFNFVLNQKKNIRLF